MRYDALCLVFDLESWLGVALVVGLGVPDSQNRVVVLQIVSPLLHLLSPAIVHTSVLETALFLSTMLPNNIALASLFFNSSATFTLNSSTSLSFSTF